MFVKTDPDAAPAALAMDRIYRHQRHFYDLTRKYYLLGRDRLIDGLTPAVGGHVLEIGCGTGRNLICAARRYPGAHFYGIDISREMLETAERAIARAGLSDRITVSYGDAAAIAIPAQWPRKKFERVFFSYSLSMIPPWRAALEQAAGAVADGGELHIVDFGGQAQYPAWFKRTLRRWLDLFEVHPVDGLSDALGAVSGLRTQIERPYFDYAQRLVAVKFR